MDESFLTFMNRDDAGHQLADRLEPMEFSHPVVYALPRGGVPVAVEVARRLNAPLDLVLVRKIGAPGNPEVALGAVVEGTPPQTVVNEEIKQLSGADDAFLERSRAEKLADLTFAGCAIWASARE